MYFYEIHLRSVPKLLFAYSVSSDHYRNRFPSYEGLLEVSIIETGTIHYDYDDGTHSETPPGSLAPILKDMHCKTHAKEGVLQKHVTVGVIADYDCRKRSITELPDLPGLREAVLRDGRILLPYQWDLGNRYGEIEGILKRIIFSCNSMDVLRIHEALSDWFHLMGVLTEIVLDRLAGRQTDKPTASEDYVRHAKLYVSEHYTDKLSVQEIADKLGISVGYLHGIFKQHTGMSVIEYVNRYRIEIIKQSLRSREISLKEAACQVGIDDPSYMSRLFKKVEGISFRAYCEHINRHSDPS